MQLLRSEGGEVEVQASGGLFGLGRVGRARWRSRAKASWSRTRWGSLLEGLQLTLFADPHVYVEGVGASEAAGRGRAAAELSADAQREPR